MSIEEAFLRAVAAAPNSQLAPKVKRFARKQRQEFEALPQPPRRREEALYRWRQLGGRWAYFRLGGCSWLGPRGALGQEWDLLWGSSAVGHGETLDRARALFELAGGIGLSDRPIDRRARDHLIRVLASTPADEAELCCLKNVRWFSPQTVLVEAMHDLANDSVAERRELRAFLAPRFPDGDQVSGGDTMRRFCGALAEWTAGTSSSRVALHSSLVHSA